MAENVELLLLKIIEIFKCKGIQSITMEQIAQYLNISKRTLYKYFPNKQSIVEEAVEYLAKFNCDACEEINDQSEDAIEALLLRMNRQNKFMVEHSKMFQDNFELMFTKGASIMEKHRNGMMDLMQKNIERGQKEGLYRQEINASMLVHYYSITMEYYILNQLPYLIINHLELSRQLFMYHIHGMATSKGLEKLNKHLAKHQLFVM